MLDVRRLKSFARAKLGPAHPLAVLLVVQDDAVSPEEYVVMVRTCLRILSTHPVEGRESLWREAG